MCFLTSRYEFEFVQWKLRETGKHIVGNKHVFLGPEANGVGKSRALKHSYLVQTFLSYIHNNNLLTSANDIRLNSKIL